MLHDRKDHRVRQGWRNNPQDNPSRLALGSTKRAGRLVLIWLPAMQLVRGRWFVHATAMITDWSAIAMMAIVAQLLQKKGTIRLVMKLGQTLLLEMPHAKVTLCALATGPTIGSLAIALLVIVAHCS